MMETGLEREREKEKAHIRAANVIIASTYCTVTAAHRLVQNAKKQSKMWWRKH